MRYARKPIEIEAVVWNGYEGVYEIVEEMVAPAPIDRGANDSLLIHTLGGTRLAHFGDYVCKDIGMGDVFVIKPEAFAIMYEPILEMEDLA